MLLKSTSDIHGNSQTRRGIRVLEFPWISEVPSNHQLTLHEPLKITIYNENSIDAFDSLPSE